MKRTLALFFLLSRFALGVIQYAGGTNVNATFVSDGTRQNLISNVQDQLVIAGWTLISGSHSATIILESATTPNSNLIRVKLSDPGSGNCAQVFIQNAAASQVSQGFFLLPTNLTVYHVIANKYQAFVFVAGGTASRQFVGFGVPYAPTFLNGVITGAFGWAQGNAASDATATIAPSFRTVLEDASGNGYDSSLINGNIRNVGGGSQFGNIRLFAQWMTSPQLTGTYSYRWHDDSQVISDPLIACGLLNQSDEAKVRGQLWDGAILSDSWAGDTALTFDSHNWTTITNSNSGSTNTARGTFAVVIP